MVHFLSGHDVSQNIEFGGSEGDLSYVPNSVDLQQFTAPPRGKQPSPTVGVMYSHVHFKGCDVALKAAGANGK